MKNLLLTLASSLLLTVNVSAQYYYIPFTTPPGSNPGGLNTDSEYPVGGGLPAGWTNILAGGMGSPTWSAVTSLPFSFDFNGSPVTSFKVSNSGVLTFDVSTPLAAPSFTKAALPNATIPDNSICIWGLNGAAANDNVVTKTFGTAPNRQFWVHFSSYGFGSSLSDGSNFTYWSIMLQETTNKIYILDCRTGGFGAAVKVVSAGIQVNSSTAYPVALSPNLVSLASADATPINNVYYEFIPGTQPNYDASVTSIAVNDFLAMVSSPFTITGTLRNYGSIALTSIVLNYSINGGAAITSSPITVSIPVFGTYTYSHPSTWSPGTSGEYTIEVWASDLNGNADANTSNDEMSKPVTVVDNMVQRMPVFEIFTSSTCGPCAAASPNIKAVFAANPDKFTAIKYQMDWPGAGDPYVNADGLTRRSFYGVSGIPDMYVDGTAEDEGSYTTPMLNAAYNIPSFMTINASYSVTGQTVHVTGTIEPLNNYTGSHNLRMHIGVFEHLTTGNIGSNGETEFHYVEHKMMPDGNGTAISSLTSGTPYTIDKTFTFPAANNVEQFTDLGVVVFVQNNSTKEVYQSSFAANPAGISGDIQHGMGIQKIFPNPVVKTAVMLYQTKDSNPAQIKVINQLGEVVMEMTDDSQTGTNQADLKMENLASGLYFVELSTGGQKFIQKIVKQ